MGKGRKNRNDYDLVDNDEQAEVTLQDFVIPAKITRLSDISSYHLVR